MKNIFYLLTLFAIYITNLNGNPIHCCDGTFLMPADGENLFINGRLEGGVSFGDFIGIDDDYMETALFVPKFYSNERISFLECRLYNFADPCWALSAGGGIRQKTNSGRIVGANVYYDCRRGKCHKDYSRIGAGLELLNDCWDLRVNGYWPFNSQCHKTIKAIKIDGQPYNKITHEFTISKGVDAEIGAPLGCFCNMSLYAAAGPYYFTHHHHHHHRTYCGGQARLESHWKFFTFQVRASYDKENKGRVQGQILATLPFKNFCCEFNNFCQDAILQPVRRIGLIFMDTHKKTEEVTVTVPSKPEQQVQQEP